MPVEALVEEARGLSEKAIIEVIHYVKFLKFEESGFSNFDLPVTRPVRAKRKAGIWKGQVKMSDDFDEPLDDFAEYM